jgi:hypothetical protein
MAKQKPLESYLVSKTAHKTSLSAYEACPAGTFLIYVCDAYDSYAHCLTKFTKKGNNTYNKDSEDSLHQIACAILSTTMGHFETYQRFLFSGILERSTNFPSFDVDRFLKHLEKSCSREVLVSPARLLAFRELDAPVGFVFADSLSGWHNPGRVNTFLKAFGITQNAFANDEIEDLEILWQLRHSVVHTGAWLTVPDAKKVKRLLAWQDKPIVFEPTFVNAMSRRLHKLVKATNARLLSDCLKLLGPAPSAAAKQSLNDFLLVKSPKGTWL